MQTAFDILLQNRFGIFIWLNRRFAEQSSASFVGTSYSKGG
jgi:hypothetical protein